MYGPKCNYRHHQILLVTNKCNMHSTIIQITFLSARYYILHTKFLSGRSQTRSNNTVTLWLPWEKRSWVVTEYPLMYNLASSPITLFCVRFTHLYTGANVDFSTAPIEDVFSTSLMCWLSHVGTNLYWYGRSWLVYWWGRHESLCV